MEQLERDFLLEMISLYGEDRFYHCCKRTRDSASALKLHMELNSCGRDKSTRFLKSIGIGTISHKPGLDRETTRETACRIACGFVRFHKELGRKKHTLPDTLNARMILGETNQWVREYALLLKSYPDWHQK